jgi:hypothetical protein
MLGEPGDFLAGRVPDDGNVTDAAGDQARVRRDGDGS